MNETTLQALINLFALFSAISESKKEEAVRNFTLYLQVHLGISSPGEYTGLFSELLDFYGVSGEPAFPLDMEQEAEKISVHIRSRLQKEEQIMVFLRFLELARSGNPGKASFLIQALARVFEIGQAELEKFTTFIFDRSPRKAAQSDFLIVDNKDPVPGESLKHITEKKLDGSILFMQSPLIRNFMFIYSGNDELTLEGNLIVPGSFYAFREGGIIRSQKISPVYYTDIVSAFIDREANAPFIFSGYDLEFRFKNSNNGLHSFDISEN